MAKCYSQKSRKEYTCSKCGKTISKGEMYYRIVENFRADRIRCCNCRPERSELTGSDYYQWLYNLQDHLSEMFELDNEGAANDVISELEDQKSELEDRLESIPEQLRDGDAGTTLQERIDALGDAIDELENLEYPDEDDDEYEEEDEAPLCYEVKPNGQVEAQEIDFSYLIGEDYDYVKSELEDSYEFVHGYGDYDENDGGTITFVCREDTTMKVTILFEKRYRKNEDAFTAAVEEYANEIDNIISNLD